MMNYIKLVSSCIVYKEAIMKQVKKKEKKRSYNQKHNL